MKVTISFEDSEMERIEKIKGDYEWREFILECVYANERKTAKIRRYIKGSIWYAEENSMGVIRRGKTEKEALIALENTLLSYPSYVLTETQRKAIPEALIAIKEAKKEVW